VFSVTDSSVNPVLIARVPNPENPSGAPIEVYRITTTPTTPALYVPNQSVLEPVKVIHSTCHPFTHHKLLLSLTVHATENKDILEYVFVVGFSMDMCLG